MVASCNPRYKSTNSVTSNFNMYLCTTSVQLPTSLNRIRFSCNQNIGERIFLVWVGASPIFWLQKNLIWMKEVGNWTEVHTYWNHFLQNTIFSVVFGKTQKVFDFKKFLWQFLYTGYCPNWISMHRLEPIDQPLNE